MNNNNGFLAEVSKKIINKKKQIFIFVFLLFVCCLQLLATANVQAGSLWNSQTGMSDIGKSFGETGDAPRDLKDVVITGIETLLGFVGLIMVIFIIYGGFVWMTAGGNEDRVKDAKKTITSAAIGVVIIICAYIIVYFVGDTARRIITDSIW